MRCMSLRDRTSRRFRPTILRPTSSALRPERKSERNDVAGDAAAAAQHRAFADAAELVHGGVAADEHVVGDLTWPPSTAPLAKMTSLPTWQSCPTCELAIRKQRSPTVVTPPPILGAGVDRHAFADLAIGADGEPRRAAAIAGRLRRRAERGERIDRRCARRSPSRRSMLTCDSSRTPARSSTLRPDGAERTDLDVVGKLRAVGHARR